MKNSTPSNNDSKGDNVAERADLTIIVIMHINNNNDNSLLINYLEYILVACMHLVVLL